MAVVNTKALAISNADSSPRIADSSYFNDGMSRISAGTVEVAAADSDGSVYRFMRLPSNARIQQILLLNDAITAGVSFDCGLYATAANGGAVVSAALFASAVDLSSARTAPLDISTEALDIASCEKRLWEILGLSADPMLDYDLALTGNTVGTAAGTISLKLSFAQ